MIISFVRHGESEANILRVLSNKPDEPYGLTENGINQIKNATLNLHDTISAVYSSPLTRTMQSAKVIIDVLDGKPKLIIDDRIAEINYGNYNGKQNDNKLDEVRKKQIAGDYNIRFGGFGENKREILMRICNFLIDMINSHTDSDYIIVVSHGVIISLTESLISQINNLQKEHVHTHNAAVKTFVMTKNDLDSIQRIINSLQ
jgi:broad specificity phosphatase PhoE